MPTETVNINDGVNDIDVALAALADSHRRQVVDLLRRAPRRAGELATGTGLSGPALSRHLRVLRSSGLVQTEMASTDARLRIYSLRREPFINLRRWLDQVELFWTDQMEAFKVYAERAQEGDRDE
jgi:DNA-binding transcriptional ArsR family regulator